MPATPTPSLSADQFDYDLPAHLIAQTPTARRDASRLLVVDRSAHSVSHHTFADLPTFLRADDILFRNNASVLPARLHARRPSGGAVECFLLRPEFRSEDCTTWWCLIRPGKKLPVGATFLHADIFSGEILAKNDEGSALVRFTTAKNEAITSIANRLGEVPLPPYINRTGAVGEKETDRDRYQTVYANPAQQVAVAAPTAGLHFTPEIFSQLASRGVQTSDLTLHVGLGTFKPITAPTLAQHVIHTELYELSPETQKKIFNPAGRRVAVGTTTVRTLEDFLSHQTVPTSAPFVAEAKIFIYPPRVFLGVDALITNFHQPRSTLLCLVSAFLTPGSTDGIQWIKEIYADAIAHEYRFFSYGDAMLIL